MVTAELQQDELSPNSKTSRPPLFPVQLFLARTIFRRYIGIRTRRIGFNSFLKCGYDVDLAEADTMSYVAKHTSIPVPKVQRAWHSQGSTYIIMEFVDGFPLSYLWFDMPQETKRHVIEQLKSYLAQLRSLKPPTEGIIASVNEGPVRVGPRVGLNQFGPFSNHDDFHRFLRVGYDAEALQALEGGPAIVKSHSQRYESKFTHGDLAPRNIMAKKDGTVTAIVDWDCAGWFPEYWEYTRAKFWPRAPPDWVASIGEMTGQYEEQLEGETYLQELCGIMITSPAG